MERIKYIHCSSCGRYLLKCRGNCEIEVSCRKCNRNIKAICSNDEVTLIELQSNKIAVSG